MSDLEIKNAVIKSAVLDIVDRGLLQGWLHLDYGGSGQGFGGWALYLPASFSHHKLMSPAGHWITRVMQVAGVGKWSELPGKTIRVLANNSMVSAIGHIVKDDWFCPHDDFKGIE